MVSKALLVFVALLVATFAAPVPGSEEAEYVAAFKQFAQKYGRSYQDANEYDMRYGVFRANYRFVKAHNATAKGYSVAINKFADLTSLEFASMMNGYKMSKRTGEVFVPKATTLPASVDWRTKGVVTGIKNQGQCGSCWSFSTTGNVEGQWFLAGHPLVSLSEQQLVDCDTVDQGCNGGLPSNAYQYIIQAGGVMSEESYSYKAAGGKCQFSSSKVVAKISNWTSISTDEAQIAAYLVAHGPLSIGINAGPMQFYFGGVADPWFCNPKSLDHGVLIVGFGVDGSKPYWIIKNSWGASWGEQGYYRIVRGKGKCGLNTMVTSALV